MGGSNVILLTSSLHIFFFPSRFATLVICVSYFNEEEIPRIMVHKREQRELIDRSERPGIDPLVNELHES